MKEDPLHEKLNKRRPFIKKLGSLQANSILTGFQIFFIDNFIIFCKICFTLSSYLVHNVYFPTFKPVRGSIHASITEFVVDSDISLILIKHSLKSNLLYNRLKREKSIKSQ